MQFKPVFLLFLLLLVSNSLSAWSLNSSTPQTRTAKILAVWESGGNGMAEIKLTIYKNHRFKFYMRILPSIGEAEGEEDLVQSKGTWKHSDGWTILKFKNKGIQLETLFGPKTVKDGRCEVLPKHKVKFGGMPKTLRIWKIMCYKQ